MTFQPDFLETLALPKPLLGDGGMGSQLIAAGLAPGACGDLWNLSHPEAVLAIQKRYVEAGSDLILTNTFGANAGRLMHQGAGDMVENVNAAGAQIAREAMGKRGFVLGDIGPYGGFLEPVGDDEADDVQKLFETQVMGLLSGGLIDGFLIETMASLDEIECVIHAIREHSDLPIFASLAFEKTAAGGLRTMMGTRASVLAQTAVVEFKIQGVGCNCGTGLNMDDYRDLVAEMVASSPLPVIVQPNAGTPEVIDGQIVYKSGADNMAKSVDILLNAGAKILGGCCGTTPEYIAAFRRLIDVRH